MEVLVIFISMVVVVKGHYHDEVGIPLVAKIKAYEDKLFADPEMESRVVGSDVADDHAYPYLASMVIRLSTGNLSVCGASLVSTSRLVTAGQCLDDAKELGVRLGSNYLFHGGIFQTTVMYAVHPRYHNVPNILLNNDIGIVILLEKAKISPRVKIISLPRTSADFEKLGEPAKIAGWGYISDAQKDDPEPFDEFWGLNEAEVPIYSENRCLTMYAWRHLQGTVICTDGAHGKGICAGDAGGPLVIMRDIPILVGVASFASPGNCEGGSPSIFSKTEYHKDFIMNF